MPIDITPEHQKLIDDAIKTGAYKTASQVIGRALERLANEDAWLRLNREAINEKIERGIAQADRGETITGEEFLSRFEERRAAYIAQNPDLRE